MNTYRVINMHTGLCFGEFEGDCPGAAVIALHREAGYGEDVVWLDPETELIQFADDDARTLIGERWVAHEIIA